MYFQAVLSIGWSPVLGLGSGLFQSTNTVSRGVPQGSVLEPLLFLIFMLHIVEIIQEHGLHFHPYVDDAQIYITSRSLYAIFFHKQLYS